MSKKLLMRCGIIAATFASFAFTTVQANDEIRIGAFLAVNGPASFLGDPQLKTMRMYVDKINAEGGVLGRQVRLVHYDYEGNASNARNLASRLVRSDRVDIIVGGSTTGGTMAAVPLIEQSRTPFISLAGAVIITDPVNPWVFKTPQSDRIAAERVLQDMLDRGITRIGLISDTGGFGASGREQTRMVAQQLGVEILEDVTYSPSDTDMTAQLTRIRNNPNVQAVFNFGFGQSPAIVTRNYAQLGIDLPFYQSHGVASNSFIELAGPAAEGLRLPASPILVPDSLADDDPQKSVTQAYVEAYEARWNEPVSTFGGYSFDGLMMAIAAIEAAGTTDREAVREALENIQGFVGVTGIFNMSPADHNGLEADSFRILEVVNGGWKLIE